MDYHQSNNPLIQYYFFMKISFTLNNVSKKIDVPGSKRLLDILRQDLELTGTKEGCGKGECGACSVLFDGKVVNSCIILACQIDGHEIITIEGLKKNGELDFLQQAFIDAGAVQCGFCTPGMIMAAKALLIENSSPSEEEIKRGLSGNLCRCTGYKKIIEAVKIAAKSNNPIIQ